MLKLNEFKKIKKLVEKFKAEIKKIDRLGYYPQSLFIADFEKVLEEDLLATELLKVYPKLDDNGRLEIARKILEVK